MGGSMQMIFRTIAPALLLLAAACATTQPPAQVSDNCPDGSLSIYFAVNESELDPIAEELLDIAADYVAGCHGSLLEVVGFADPTGDAQANLVLSEQRALSVLEGLAARGVTADRIVLHGEGDEGAVTADGLTEPMRRRVQIRYVPAGR